MGSYTSPGGHLVPRGNTGRIAKLAEKLKASVLRSSSPAKLLFYMPAVVLNQSVDVFEIVDHMNFQ